MASRSTTLKKSWAWGGFIFEMKILVAARHACGDQFSGWVRARIRAHWGRDGITLKAFGRGPDLYPRRRKPTLQSVSREYGTERAGHTLYKRLLLWDPIQEQGRAFHGLRQGRINDVSISDQWCKEPWCTFLMTAVFWVSSSSNLAKIMSASVRRSPALEGRRASNVCMSPESMFCGKIP